MIHNWRTESRYYQTMLTQNLNDINDFLKKI
jgi:hypothetical protein